MSPQLKFSYFPSPISYDQILTIPLTFYYFIFLVPYRLKINKIDNKYEVSSSILKKVICGAVHIAKISEIVYVKIHTAFYLIDDSEKNVVNGRNVDSFERNRLFSVLQILPEICVPLIVSWITFKGQRQLCQLANELRDLGRNLSTNKSFTLKPLVTTCLLCIAPIAATAISYVPEMLIYENILPMGVDYVLKTYREGPLHHPLIYFPLKYILKTFIYLTHMVNSMFEPYGVLILLCILNYVKRFRESLENNDDMEQCYLLFGNLRRFIKFCNEKLALNTFMLASFLDFIFAYSQLSEQILFTQERGSNEKHGTNRVINLIMHSPYLLMSLSIWAMSAEVNRVIANSMNDWIERQQLRQELSLQDRVKLLGIGNEFDRKTVGISCRFFTVTYPFISSMVGLLLTFIMIANQSSPRGANKGCPPAM